MAYEIEIKLEFPASFDPQDIWTDAILCNYTRTTNDFQAIYYDTPDGLLAAKKQTLRMRKEGDVGMIAFKAATEDDNVRREWEAPADNLLYGITKLMEYDDCPIHEIKFLNFDVVCTMYFKRTTALITVGDTTAEVAVDIGEMRRNDKTALIRELEIELKGGNVADLQKLTDNFAAKYNLTVQPMSKLEHALNI